MKRFVIRTVVFSSIVLILMFVADAFLSNQLRLTNCAMGEYSVWNDIYNSKIDADIVIYGSSRAWVNIDPSIIKEKTKLRTYNLGIDGHNFFLQYFRHHELLKFCKKPKLIILSVDIFTLEKRPDLYNSEQFLPYMYANSSIYQNTKQHIGFNLFDFYVPLIRYYGFTPEILAVLKYQFEQITPKRTLGYEGQKRNWSDEFSSAQNDIAKFHANIDGMTLKLLDDFIKECVNSEIDVILVYAPIHTEGQLFIENNSEIINIFSQITLNNKIEFLNYLNDSLCGDRKYFYNSTHLNKTGAELFTQKLAKDIDSLYSKDLN